MVARRRSPHARVRRVFAAGVMLCCLAVSAGCFRADFAKDFVSAHEQENSHAASAEAQAASTNAATNAATEAAASAATSAAATETVTEEPERRLDANALRARLRISEDYRDSFVHGPKGADVQKYIVLHDTEGGGDASGVIDYWDSNGAGVAAHFVINKDGSIVQCVPLDKIAHHAGFGDTGHNQQFGVTDESRDDKVGTQPIGSWAQDYGMNSYSIGIELVHMGGEGDYPEAQLSALDGLIAYLDAYYGKQSAIIDHKAWRTGNSDTSAEFADYLANYQSARTHNGEPLDVS